MRTFEYSNRFLRDYKLCKKQGKNMGKLHTILKMLETEEAIPPQYKDHPLKHNWQGYRDLHIEPDWILIYQIKDNKIVLLAATGTHTHTL